MASILYLIFPSGHFGRFYYKDEFPPDAIFEKLLGSTPIMIETNNEEFDFITSYDDSIYSSNHWNINYLGSNVWRLLNPLSPCEICGPLIITSKGKTGITAEQAQNISEMCDYSSKDELDPEELFIFHSS